MQSLRLSVLGEQSDVLIPGIAFAFASLFVSEYSVFEIVHFKTDWL